MIKVVIIDDHAAIVDAFSHSIDAEEDMCCVGGATSTSSIFALLEKVSPDVILTDISMENSRSGIVLTEQIKLRFPDIKNIVMSGFDEISYIPAAKEAGADAFMSKRKPISEFIDMIHAVMRGEGYFPSPVEVTTAEGEPPFSARELEVLRLLCSCLSRQEIADKLRISKGTVKRHVENMLTKSSCKTVMEMVVHVVNNFFIFPK